MLDDVLEGRTHYRPHPGQLAVHKSKASRRVLACGARWGKTVCAAYECVAALLEPRRQALGWCVGPTFDIARLVFERAAIVVHERFPHRVRDYNLREQRLTVTNLGGGVSTLKGRSADYPASLLGEALDFLVLDEAARVDDEVWHSHLSQRLLDRAGWALLISTPGDRNWFWWEFRRGQKNRDPGVQSWQSPTWDNPYVARELIDAEGKRLPEVDFAQQYRAEFSGIDLSPCDSCGFPNPRRYGMELIDQGDEHALCMDCRHEVGSDQRTIWGVSDGVPSLVLITFCPRPSGEEARLEYAQPEVDDGRGLRALVSDGREMVFEV